MWWSNVKQKLEISPLFKTFISVFNIVISSILSGIFVSEISVNGLIEWNIFYKAKSFYFILLWCFLLYTYLRFQFNIEQSIEKYKDDEYCKAYMRKQCLPELAKKVNGLIKNGKSKGHLKNLMTDLNL